jgi:hypothetical protein
VARRISFREVVAWVQEEVWVVLRCCQDTDLDRLQSQTPEVISGFFVAYKEAKEGIPEERIFNWDETGLMRVGRWSKVGVEKNNAGAVKRSSGKASTRWRRGGLRKKRRAAEEEKEQ